MQQTASTPTTEYLSISVYYATPGVSSDMFISRMAPPRAITPRILRHYRGISLASMHRVANLCADMVRDNIGRVYPRGDGWLFQGHRPVVIRRNR